MILVKRCSSIIIRKEVRNQLLGLFSCVLLMLPPSIPLVDVIVLCCSLITFSFLDSRWFQAYEKTQPKTIFREVEDEQEEEKK